MSLKKLSVNRRKLTPQDIKNLEDYEWIEAQHASDFVEGLEVKETDAYDGLFGEVIERRGNFIVVFTQDGEQESYHFTDLLIADT